METLVPVSADMGEGDPFTPSTVFSGEQIISRKPQGLRGRRGGEALVKEYQWQWNAVWADESNANFFRCFLNCCVVMEVL